MPGRPFRALVPLAAALVVAAVAAPAGAQEREPLTPRTVGQNVADESRRASERSEKAVRKAGKQTEKQARRTRKQAQRVVSREERERQAAEKRAGTP